MKLATAYGAGWFFGSMIFVTVFMNGIITKPETLLGQIGLLMFIGFVVGGCAFSWKLYEVLDEDRKQELRDRRKVLSE